LPENLWSLMSTFQPEEVGRTWKDVDPSLWERWNESKGWAAENRILHLNFSHYLAEDLLPKVDRASMAVGLEVRCPFLDKDLVEFSLSLNGREHFNLFLGKKLLRQSCADLLPPAIQRRPKMGFGIPIAHLFRATPHNNPDGPKLPEILTRAEEAPPSAAKRWLLQLYQAWLGEGVLR